MEPEMLGNSKIKKDKKDPAVFWIFERILHFDIEDSFLTLKILLRWSQIENAPEFWKILKETWCCEYKRGVSANRTME